MASKQQKPYLGELCPSCQSGHFKVPENEQEWHVVCDECEAIQLVYEPLPHQYTFHADSHKYKMFAGGYGSGKTTTACMETIDHILETPNGRTLIGAETLPQLEQTAMKEFFEIFPQELIASYNKQKNTLVTHNGHTVMFRPLDDEQKARSLNLTFFWIEEANGVGYNYFVQLQTRLRNTATEIQRGILSTNPDMGWVKTEVLLKADKIYNAEEEYHQNEDELNINISVHIAPTHLNIHLPPNYREDTARGKPKWWVARYLDGSFQNKEGLVYPQYESAIVDDFEIPRHWKRYIGGDFGLNNPTAFTYFALDPETGTLYLYGEHKQAQKPVSYHADKLTTHLNSLAYNVIEMMVGDAAGQQRSEVDLRSTFDHYAEYGIYWHPSTKKLEDSISKMFSYFELERIKIFRSCVEFLEEIQEYRYPERKLDKPVKDEKIFEKPIAVNNHLLDSGRYVIAELPDNPDELINESYNAMNTMYDIVAQRRKVLPKELQEDNEYSYSSDSWMAY